MTMQLPPELQALAEATRNKILSPGHVFFTREIDATQERLDALVAEGWLRKSVTAFEPRAEYDEELVVEQEEDGTWTDDMGRTIPETWLSVTYLTTEQATVACRQTPELSHFYFRRRIGQLKIELRTLRAEALGVEAHDTAARCELAAEALACQSANSAQWSAWLEQVKQEESTS